MTQNVIPTSVFFIKSYTPRQEIQITKADGGLEDVRPRTVLAQFRKPVTVAIGSFRLKVINSGGMYNDIFPKRSEVQLNADMSAGTTRRFRGIIDSTNAVSDGNGQFLEIIGRHISYLTVEK